MVWSQWDGYLTSPANEECRGKLAARGVPLDTIHTSGHASIMDLKRLAEALAPDALGPCTGSTAIDTGSYSARTCVAGWMVNGGGFDSCRDRTLKHSWNLFGAIHTSKECAGVSRQVTFFPAFATARSTSMRAAHVYFGSE